MHNALYNRINSCYNVLKQNQIHLLQSGAKQAQSGAERFYNSSGFPPRNQLPFQRFINFLVTTVFLSQMRRI